MVKAFVVLAFLFCAQCAYSAEVVGSAAARTAGRLKVHGIFKSNMVLQRDKPITIWGWASAGTTVNVTFGKLAEAAKATGEKGRWQVVFKPQSANAQAQTLTVKAGGQTVEYKNIVIGDV